MVTPDGLLSVLSAVSSCPLVGVRSLTVTLPKVRPMLPLANCSSSTSVIWSTSPLAVCVTV